MVATKEGFSGHADPELLASLREIANNQGREFQYVLEDAIRAFVESYAELNVRSGHFSSIPPEMFQSKPRNSVMKHFHESVEKNRRLGELLAR